MKQITAAWDRLFNTNYSKTWRIKNASTSRAGHDENSVHAYYDY